MLNKSQNLFQLFQEKAVYIFVEIWYNIFIVKERRMIFMSLAITLYNHHGIVMCADKLVNAILDGKEIHQSFTEQKLFLVEGKYGLSYTGTASIDGVPTSALIEEYLGKNKINDTPPNVFLEKLANYFHSIQSYGQNIVFILCGFFNGEKFIITTNTIAPEISPVVKQSGILYSGENKFVKLLVGSDLIAFDFKKFTLYDFSDFARFIVKTVSGMMQFGQYMPTVSPHCDILIIKPNAIEWLPHDYKNEMP